MRCVIVKPAECYLLFLQKKECNELYISMRTIVYETTCRSTQSAQSSLAKADYYSPVAHCIMCMKECEAAER